MKVTIKIGAKVGQDHQFKIWNEKYFPAHELTTAFTCKPLSLACSGEHIEITCIDKLERYVCTAYGFGLVGQGSNSYGSGSIHVRGDDLEVVQEDVLPTPQEEGMDIMRCTNPTPRFWMVWKEGGNTPTRQHASYDEAWNEANRLAVKHPGSKFYVLVASSGVMAEVRPSFVKIPVT